MYPNTTSMCYGHRFSLIYCSGDPASADRIATDVCAYNGRGCMAPVAICSHDQNEEFIQALEIAIAEHRQEYPPVIDSSLQPFIRQHIMKTLAIGTRVQRNHQNLCILPIEHWTQNTLPNVFDIHHVTHNDLYSRLLPWRNNLSSLSTDMSTPLGDLFPRVVPLGEIQKPAFPRNHDGYPMFMSSH